MPWMILTTSPSSRSSANAVFQALAVLRSEASDRNAALMESSA
jgi:hypothetical protein